MLFRSQVQNASKCGKKQKRNKQIPHVKIKHCYREANRCADNLARMGANQILDFILYDDPPGDLGVFVEADCNGASTARQCPGSFVVS